MWKIVRFGVESVNKICFFTMVNKRRFGIGPKLALFMDKYDNPVGNAKVFSSILVKLYRAMPPSFRVVS